MPDDQARSGDGPPAHPTRFQFPITWLSAYATFPETSRYRALVKSSASHLWDRPQTNPGSAGWSMVVPKMQRQRPAPALQIAAPAPMAAPSGKNRGGELLAFFGPAAALAACLALLLIQFLPSGHLKVFRVPDYPRVIPAHLEQAAAEPNTREMPRATPSIPRRTHQASRPSERSSEVARIMEAPAAPAPAPAPEVPAAPAAYQTTPPLEPQSTEGFESSRVLKKVKPVYPELATAERVQGTVRLKATISKDGTVQKVVPESGPVMLFDAASEAVRQWMFLPARLNGDAIEDVIHINIGFAIVSPEQQAER